MNIMVFDVPAETVGALSILNEFYNEVSLYKNKNINWIFVVSTPNLKKANNIKVLRFPWVKKNWLYRLYFDYFIAPKLVKKHYINKVLSFQNVIIPHTKVEQILYMHNSLPFVDYKFTFKENKHLWLYQNIVGISIINSIKRASKVIVQSEWIKKACIQKSNVLNEKIEVISPNVNLEIKSFFKLNKNSLSTFFYPASEFAYKNHKIIVDACKMLSSKNITEFKVIFTLKGNENEHISKLYKEINLHKLPIEFIGSIERDQVFNLYTRSILLFPSFIETFGLPMLEARLHKTIIIASDCSFSHEVLNGYENAYFFKPFDESKLSELMESTISGEVSYFDCENEESISINSKILNRILEIE